MKRISIKLPLAMMLCTLLFQQCKESENEKTIESAESRAKTISTLVNNDVYMNQVMDSMRTKHSDAMMSSMTAKGDKEKMMNNMMEMCKTDSSMCKMMMVKTMDMCETDSSMCKMMMSSMKGHPKVMKSMGEMDNMKGMKMK